MFRISEGYYLDSFVGLPNFFQRCARDWQCSSAVVNAYMKRYVPFCYGFKLTADENVPSSFPLTCGAMARIHLGGPYGCRQRYTAGFGRINERCYRERKTASGK